MERQFTYVKRFAVHEFLFSDEADLYRVYPEVFADTLPVLPYGKRPEVDVDNFLKLYCMQDS